MKLYVSRVACTCTATLALFAVSVFAQSSALEPARLAPDELKWAPTPTGTQRANLAGDDKKAGMYAYRARFPIKGSDTTRLSKDDVQQRP